MYFSFLYEHRTLKPTKSWHKLFKLFKVWTPQPLSWMALVNEVKTKKLPQCWPEFCTFFLPIKMDHFVLDRFCLIIFRLFWTKSIQLVIVILFFCWTRSGCVKEMVKWPGGHILLEISRTSLSSVLAIYFIGWKRLRGQKLSSFWLKNGSKTLWSITFLHFSVWAC